MIEGLAAARVFFGLGTIFLEPGVGTGSELINTYALLELDAKDSDPPIVVLMNSLSK